MLWLRRLRHSPRLAVVRAHWPIVMEFAGLRELPRRRRLGLGLIALGWIGWIRRYRRNRAAGLALYDDHLTKLRRLRPEVLDHFYTDWVGSMEVELAKFPAYDQHKHEQRYDLITRLAVENTPANATVVDVGCDSAMVLDRVTAITGSRGIGLDLAPFGLRQRVAQAAPPVLAQAVVQEIPLPDDIADVVIFSEVIEHLIDAYAGLAEIGRITRLGGVVILTTNNASEMPEVSPLADPLTWAERLIGRRRPSLLAFRNIMWPEEIPEAADPLPRDTPTYVPHIHMAFAELRDLAADAGFDVISAGSFEFPAPQSRFAGWLRALHDAQPTLGLLVADGLERTIAATPGLSLMGTHNLLVLRKTRQPQAAPTRPWWPATMVAGDPVDAIGAVPSA